MRDFIKIDFYQVLYQVLYCLIKYLKLTFYTKSSWYWINKVDHIKPSLFYIYRRQDASVYKYWGPVRVHIIHRSFPIPVYPTVQKHTGLQREQYSRQGSTCRMMFVKGHMTTGQVEVEDRVSVCDLSHSHRVILISLWR